MGTCDIRRLVMRLWDQEQSGLVIPLLWQSSPAAHCSHKKRNELRFRSPIVRLIEIMNRQELYPRFGMVDEHNLLYSIPTLAAVPPSANPGPAPEISLPGSNPWGSPVVSAQADVYKPAPTSLASKKTTSTKRGKAASAGKTAAKKKRKCGRPLTGYNIFFKEQVRCNCFIFPPPELSF